MERIDTMFTFQTVSTLVGVGGASQVGKVSVELLAKNALVVTDTGVRKSGLVDRIEKSLETEGVKFGIFDACRPDAPADAVEECTRVAKDGRYDLIIGVGGGSVIDTAKAASILAIGKETLNDILGFDRVKQPGLRKVFIPTTAGTGSELTKVAVVGDKVDGLKKVIYSKHLCADKAIIDPLMTLNLPPRITADTGMDALTHAIESYTTWKGNIVSDMYAEKAIQLIADNLPIAFAKGPKHLEVRYNLAVAAGLAILGAETAAGGIVHSMNYPIAAKAGVSHGTAVTIMLPYVMEFNLIGNLAKYRNVAKLMGEEIRDLSPMDGAQRAVEAVRRLIKLLGMPQRLSDIGIKKGDISEFVDFLFKFQSYGIENNVRDVSQEDATRIFEAAL